MGRKTSLQTRALKDNTSLAATAIIHEILLLIRIQLFWDIYSAVLGACKIVLVKIWLVLFHTQPIMTKILLITDPDL